MMSLLKRTTTLGKVAITIIAILLTIGIYEIIPHNKDGNIVSTDSKETATNAKVILKISGSNTIGESLAPALVKGYLENLGYKNVSVQDSSKEDRIINATDLNGNPIQITISAHGTSKGFESLSSGNSDMCMASVQSKSPLEEHIIGLDGIAVIINNSSVVSDITVEELSAIFSGKITDWNQVKSSQMTGKINMFRMDNNSGTSKMFKELLGNIDYDETSKSLESAKEMVTDIGTTKNSIGFVSFSFLNSTVKTIPIRVGNVSIEPNALSIQSEKYPFCRRLYIYKDPSKTDQFESDLLKYAESKDGQKIVENCGFIDLSVNYDKPVSMPGDPKEYTNLIDNAHKLTSELRFNTGSTNLDARAIADVDRLIQFLSQPDNRKKSIVLVGFSDNVGDPNSNKNLSKQRAESVRILLEQKGASVKDIYGLGIIRPSHSNDSEEGRSSNRRVEIWIL